MSDSDPHRDPHRDSPGDDLMAGIRGLAARYGTAPAEVVPTRPDVVIVRAGDIVVKAHAPGAPREPLERRMRTVAHPALRGILLEPVTEEVVTIGGRLVTVWPAGTPVDPADPEAAPWEEAARLLARLHAVPAGQVPPPPAAGGPGKVVAMAARLRGNPSAAARAVRGALACLPTLEDVPGPAGLTHGDWHMGQLVRTGDGWILIDVDDLGVGDQAWDLARPAAWFAAGLLDPAVWHRFLDAYRAAGGPATGAGDPWERLNLPAQATTVQLAAAALSTAEREGRALDEVEEALVETCQRIVQFRTACHSVPTQ
ncbi:aminoglycoside phosphotransferase family protein [Streptosporangium saharense]|uniref:aminoglycoside phosphotransferase family protein n=1 Tax=Streptosporangium saharense TaxID=1706840 RepID=UPI00342A883C